MDMIQTIIVEDQPKSLKTLQELVRHYCPDIQVVETASSIRSAREKILHYSPDLVFLDVQLPDGECFQLLEELDEVNFKVIFTTAHDHYAIRAIKFSALDYLLKPVDRHELVVAVEKYRQSQPSEAENIRTLIDNLKSGNAPKKIVISTFYKIHIVQVSDIIHVESHSSYSNFHLTNGMEILSTKTLKEQDELLSPFNFVRIHRSHLVNFNHIVEYEKADGGFVVMSNGDKLAVSQYRKDILLERLGSL